MASEPSKEYVVQSDQSWLRQQLANTALKDALHTLAHIGSFARGDHTQREGDEAGKALRWATGILNNNEACRSE